LGSGARCQRLPTSARAPERTTRRAAAARADPAERPASATDLGCQSGTLVLPEDSCAPSKPGVCSQE
jgi:hypothetical protein